MWLTLAIVGCSLPTPEIAAPPPPPSHAEHMAMMEKQRETLKRELGDAYDQPIPDLGDADPARGEAIYKELCLKCHGAGGAGDGPRATALDPPPADLTDPFHAQYYSDAGRVRIIAVGSPGTGMGGFETRLEPTEIVDVYAYILRFRDPSSDGHTGHDH